ncbi:hypothetical protein F4780DRAFT_273973 [Xylariomycetidae sp. FL0641]|nr:hypothetical protein F4780DRAFT_273973 [Xylariomycetidae sp. FL0641]
MKICSLKQLRSSGLNVVKLYTYVIDSAPEHGQHRLRRRVLYRGHYWWNSRWAVISSCHADAVLPSRPLTAAMGFAEFQDPSRTLLGSLQTASLASPATGQAGVAGDSSYRYPWNRQNRPVPDRRTRLAAPWLPLAIDLGNRCQGCVALRRSWPPKPSPRQAHGSTRRPCSGRTPRLPSLRHEHSSGWASNSPDRAGNACFQPHTTRTLDAPTYPTAALHPSRLRSARLHIAQGVAVRVGQNVRWIFRVFQVD